MKMVKMSNTKRTPGTTRIHTIPIAPMALLESRSSCALVSFLRVADRVVVFTASCCNIFSNSVSLIVETFLLHVQVGNDKVEFVIKSKEVVVSIEVDVTSEDSVEDVVG